MSDYRRMLKLAGLNESMIEAVASEREAQDELNDIEAEKRFAWENGIEKNIKLIARRTGVELTDTHAIYINDDNQAEVKSDTGNGMPLSHLLQFASQLAANGIGSNVQINGSSEIDIMISFTIHA